MNRSEWIMDRFERTLAEYQKHSKKTFARIVNTKALWIARQAMWFTAQASVERMGNELGKYIKVQRTTRTGRTVNSRKMVLAPARDHKAPLAAILVNWRLGKKQPKEKGLYGRAMRDAVKQLVSARIRSVAFIKSGWIPALKKYLGHADTKGAPAEERGPKIYGDVKGDATLAQEGDEPVAEFSNRASPTRDKKNILKLIGGSALDKAFEAETASMEEYIERKMNEDAEKFNRAQN